MVEENLRRGFDVIGDAAILKFSGVVSKQKKAAAALQMMKKNSHIKRVFEKAGKTAGEERIAKIVCLAGEKSSLVLKNENVCSFYFDIRKVYFSPRLGSERLRIRRLVKNKEVVLDMFCGAGPYAIEIAKVAKEVFAVDINRNATALLKKNIVLNKITNLTVLTGDSNKVVRKISRRFDRIIMNFPLDSRAFLDSAVSVAEDKCVIHYYFFANTVGGYEKRVKEEIGMIKRRLEGAFRLKCTYRNTGEVAPYLSRVCLDLHLKKI